MVPGEEVMVWLGMSGLLCILGATILGLSGFESHPDGWYLFTGAVALGFLWQFGRRGDGALSLMLELLGGVGIVVVSVMLLFVSGWESSIAASLGALGSGSLGTLSIAILRSGHTAS